jgi:hypothetical protein
MSPEDEEYRIEMVRGTVVLLEGWGPAYAALVEVYRKRLGELTAAREARMDRDGE